VEDKKVLIITYYWPPSGGSGVQRWLKFVKYLPQFGYTPYVFTPENPSFDLKDESLLKDVPIEAEVMHFPIWEPYHLFFSLSRIVGGGKQGGRNLVSTGKKSLFQRCSAWLRGNFFIPDPRVFWVKPSVSFLTDFVKDNRIRTVITTGPPHSVHLIGLRLKRKNPSLKWIADFRDPWSEWGLLDSLSVGSVARAIHARMERRVLMTADRVITITPFYVRRFSALGGRPVDLVTNGFDEEDFVEFAPQQTGVFTIRHVGIINEKCDPRPFMMAVRELALGDEEFRQKVRIDFIGDVHPDFADFVKSDDMLSKLTSLTPPVPHNALRNYYESSSLLILILTGYKDAQGYMPGKLFEYMATGLPVLGVGPLDGDAAALMKSSGIGIMIDSDDLAGIRQQVLAEFNRWKTGVGPGMRKPVEQYSRRGTTATLVRLLDGLQ
jgi:glycosyltransferase involved in cell wall biosynthesis